MDVEAYHYQASQAKRRSAQSKMTGAQRVTDPSNVSSGSKADFAE
jgi:hypothetical protein